MSQQRVIIVSGLSGAGKSTALHALEDMGFYCVDNLPIALLPALGQELARNDTHPPAAVGIDARNFSDLQAFPGILSAIRASGTEPLLRVMVEARDAAGWLRPIASPARVTLPVSTSA